jgi:hypothetical protein
VIPIHDRPIVQVLHRLETFDISPSDWGGYVWAQCVHESDTKTRIEAFETGGLVVDGQVLNPADAKLLRAEITGQFEELPPLFDPTTEPGTRALIPGLMSHDTIPALSGPKGVGKTTFVCQLAAAFIIDGRRFLDLLPCASCGACRYVFCNPEARGLCVTRYVKGLTLSVAAPLRPGDLEVLAKSARNVALHARQRDVETGRNRSVRGHR